jgi:hypothetical protein
MYQRIVFSQLSRIFLSQQVANGPNVDPRNHHLAKYLEHLRHNLLSQILTHCLDPSRLIQGLIACNHLD